MNLRRLIPVAGAVLIAIVALALKCGEDPPSVPTITPPTATIYRSAEAAFRLAATQPQEKNIKYVVNWGDNITDTSAIDYPSGTEVTLRHVWAQAGSYEVKALAYVADNPELASDWSDPVTVTVEPNEAPTNVTLIDPPFQVARRRWVYFEASATDPENDSVQYQFNFGDGNQGSWTTPLVPSGAPGLDSHRFTNLGTFYVKVRARDQKGSMSGWSDSARVVVDTTGVVNWHWVSPDDDEGAATGSALILTRNEEELIYVGAEDEFGRAYGIRVATGRHAVRTAAQDEDYFTGHLAYVAATGNIIIGNENGILFAYDLGLSRRWSFPDTISYIEWGVPAVNGTRLYVTRDDDRLYYLSDLGASARYETAANVPDIKGNPVIVGTEVAVVTGRGRLLYFNGTNLNVVWDTLLTADSLPLNGLAVGSAGHLYVAGADGKVHCINPDRTIAWTATVEGEAANIVLGDGAVYVTTNRGRIYRFNPASPGTPVWVRALTNADDIETSPILTSNGLIYIQDDDDVLHCIKQDDGAYVWLVDCAAELNLHRSSGGRRGRRDFELPPSHPTLASNGDVILVGADALYSVSGYTEGTLAATAWPKWQGGIHNTGKAGSF